jgi:hypothetical protein
VWRQSWLSSRCPRRASTWSWMGLSKPSLKMSLSTPFRGKWTAALCTSESAVSRPLKVQK